MTAGSGNALLEQVLAKDPSLGSVVSALRWLGLRRATTGEAIKSRADRLLVQLEAHLDRCDEEDFTSLAEIASTDPVSVLHALHLFRDEAVSAAIANQYNQLLVRLSDASVQIAAPRAHGVLARMFSDLDVTSPYTPEQMTDLDDFNPTAFAISALAASDLGTHRADSKDTRLQFLSRASLLLSARRRNLTETGLMLLAHAICFADDDVSHILAWLTRIQRSDGLYGSWELFADDCSGANLAASVNVEWARAARQTLGKGSPNADFPMRSIPEAPFCTPERTEVEEAVDRIRGWIDANIETFIDLQFPDQAAYGDRVKPLVELTLALWVVARLSPHSSHGIWAKGVANRIDAISRGEKLVEGVRIFPTSILAALMFPMLEDLTGRRHAHHDELQKLVWDRMSEWQERIPMRQMDYFFLRWLFLHDPVADDQAIHDHLDKALVSGGVNPCYLTNDSAYDITHAIFYATKFGVAPFEGHANARAWCSQWMPELCVSFLLEDDFDLGGELVMNWLQLGLPRDERYAFALRLLLANLNADGSAPGPRRQSDYAKLSPFERDYHTTLIVLVALVGALGNHDS